MSAKQSGNTEQFADGTAASPSIQIGRPDTGFYLTRDADGVPNGLGVSIAGAGQNFTVAQLDAAPVNGAAASADLTDGNATAPDDGDQLTIAGKTYTFRTALTPLEGEVLINVTADAALLNLARAINHTGTPNTDYKCAAANANVSSSASVTAHAITLTARTPGAAGNALTVTQDVGTSFTVVSPLADGVDSTPAPVGGFATFDGDLYFAPAGSANASDTTAWFKLTSTAV
jgi:hypothetical protein